jgi:hypothetical protein
MRAIGFMDRHVGAGSVPVMCNPLLTEDVAPEPVVEGLVSAALRVLEGMRGRPQADHRLA